MRIPFRTGAIPLIATLLLVALGVTLGRWQDGRAEQKLALAARIATANAAAPLVLHGEQVAPERALWRRIAVTGTFVRDWPVYLDNRPNGGRAGFVLLMPFRIGHTATSTCWWRAAGCRAIRRTASASPPIPPLPAW
jgi:surfeit locus 1 family protein